MRVFSTDEEIDAELRRLLSPNIREQLVQELLHAEGLQLTGTLPSELHVRCGKAMSIRLSGVVRTVNGKA